MTEESKTEQTEQVEPKQPGIWKASFQLLWQCRTSFLIAIVLMLGLVFWQLTGSFAGQVYVVYLLGFAIWGFLALSLFNATMNGRREIAALKIIDKPRLKLFAGRYLLLQVLVTLPSSLILFVMTGSFMLSVEDTTKVENLVALGVTAPVTFVSLWIAIVFFATLLPAALAGDSSGIGRSFARGRKTVWYVTGRVLIGPVVWLFLTSIIVNIVQTAGGEPLISSDGVFQSNMTTVMTLAISSLQYGFIGGMLAVIVTRAYHLGETRLAARDMPSLEEPVEAQVGM